MNRHVLLFWIGPTLYALWTAAVREIVPAAALTTAPGQPPLLRGFLNLRGTAVPVVRLRHLFALEERAPQRYTPLIVVESSGDALALEVDALEEVIELEQQAVQSLGQDHSANDCALGIFAWQEREVVLLSWDRLLLAQERASLQMLQTAVQQRLGELDQTAR